LILKKRLAEKKVPVRQNETLDLLFNGSLKVIQMKKGYRFSIDAILLAHFTWCHHRHVDTVVDLGTGSGVIPLILAHRFREAKIVGVEVQETLAELAHRNVTMNSLTDRIFILKGDLRSLKESYAPASFDLVLSNPPFYPAHAGRINPRSERAIARHELIGSLEDMVKIASYLLKYKGRLVMIYPAFRLIDLIHQLRSNGLEPKLMRVVHSRADSEGKLILLSCSKNGRAALKVLKPLIIYQGVGKYTEDLLEIYQWVGSPLQEVTHPLLLVKKNSFNNQ
jgi:tRNA1Val (adenine37-N6)-methyltransferase